MQQSPLMAVEQNLEAVHLAIPDLPHDLLVLHHCLLFKRNTGQIENGYENSWSGVPEARRAILCVLSGFASVVRYAPMDLGLRPGDLRVPRKSIRYPPYALISAQTHQTAVAYCSAALITVSKSANAGADYLRPFTKNVGTAVTPWLLPLQFRSGPPGVLALSRH